MEDFELYDLNALMDKYFDTLKLEGDHTAEYVKENYLISLEEAIPEHKPAIESLYTKLVKDFKLGEVEYPISVRIKEMLRLNMSEQDLQHILQAVTSPEYARFFSILSEVVNEVAFAQAEMIELSMLEEGQKLMSTKELLN